MVILIFLNKILAQLKGVKLVSLDEALSILMSGFLRGGVGFLKGTGEIIKGSSGVNREVRVGVTHVSDAYIVYVYYKCTLNIEGEVQTAYWLVKFTSHFYPFTHLPFYPFTLLFLTVDNFKTNTFYNTFN